MQYKTDIEITQSCKMKPIQEIADIAHVDEKYIEQYGRYKAKIDLYKSGTRKEELLLAEEEMNTAYKLRGLLGDKSNGTSDVLEVLKKSKNNNDLHAKLDTWMQLFNK